MPAYIKHGRYQQPRALPKSRCEPSISVPHWIATNANVLVPQETTLPFAHDNNHNNNHSSLSTIIPAQSLACNQRRPIAFLAKARTQTAAFLRRAWANMWERQKLNKQQWGIRESNTIRWGFHIKEYLCLVFFLREHKLSCALKTKKKQKYRA